MATIEEMQETANEVLDAINEAYGALGQVGVPLSVVTNGSLLSAECERRLNRIVVQLEDLRDDLRADDDFPNTL